MPDDSDDKPDLGQLLIFPGGEKISPADVGADFVLAQSGHVPTPEIVDSVAVSKTYIERRDFVESEPLRRAVVTGAPTTDVINIVFQDIAEELAHLKFERQVAARGGKNTAAYTLQRIASLKSFSEALTKRLENSRAEQLDLKSPRFKVILKLWLEFVCESMEKSGVDEETIDVILNQMKADMVGWEQKILEQSS